MIRSLEIENFKGIGARQRIELAPLTLLFGANSAGKSTVLQALLYLHEIIERGSADVDRTELGGNVLELGGFGRLVHRHEIDRAIVLRAEFATSGGLERFGRDVTDFPFPDLDDEVESAWLELSIRFRTSPTYRGPLVERAAIGVGNEPEPLIWLETGATLREGEALYARVNLAHPQLAKARRDDPPLWEKFVSGENLPNDTTSEIRDKLSSYDELLERWKRIAVAEDVLSSALGSESERERDAQYHIGFRDNSVGRTRYLPVFAIARSRFSAVPPMDESLRVLPFGDIDADREELSRLMLLSESEESKQRAPALRESIRDRERAASEVRTFLEMVVLGTIGQLVSFLRDALYIGPLRTIPPRGFLYERAGRVTSWADGLAGWDLLLADRANLVEDTNLWLKRLGSGCQVVVQQLFDIGADAEELTNGHVDKTVRRLLLDTGAGSFVLPSEVGAGVSQIIPVIVAALERHAGLTLAEQPEIHVHPAVQVGLGDLFIDAVTRQGGRRLLLIETHSEHLLLRVMRRMRETFEHQLPEGMQAVGPKDVSIMLIERDGPRTIVRQMPLNERGELVKAWPGGFFEEGLREVF